MSFFGVVASFLLAGLFSHILSRQNFMLDHPNLRSMHEQAIPRSGGIAILLAIFMATILSMGTDALMELTWIATAVLMLIPITYIDDQGHVHSVYRLLVQILAAAIIVFKYLPQHISLPGFEVSLPFVILYGVLIIYIVWVINLYNFMDGLDGLASGMAVIGFSVLAVLGWQSDAMTYVELALIIAAASAGFLLFNFPPARIFMGDLGSIALGFLVAIMTLWGEAEGIVPFWISILVFLPFIVDTTLTLLRRMFNGEKIWEAHRTHMYQLFAEYYGKTRLLLSAYGLMLASGMSAILAFFVSEPLQWVIIALWAFCYGLIRSKLKNFIPSYSRTNKQKL